MDDLPKMTASLIKKYSHEEVFLAFLEKADDMRLILRFMDEKALALGDVAGGVMSYRAGAAIRSLTEAVELTRDVIHDFNLMTPPSDEREERFWISEGYANALLKGIFAFEEEDTFKYLGWLEETQSERRGYWRAAEDYVPSLSACAISQKVCRCIMVEFVPLK